MHLFPHLIVTSTWSYVNLPVSKSLEFHHKIPPTEPKLSYKNQVVLKSDHAYYSKALIFFRRIIHGFIDI